MARELTANCRQRRRARLGVATVACVLVAGLGTTATWAGYGDEQPSPGPVQHGLTAVRVPAVERMQRPDPVPLPAPSLAASPRLRLERLDGTLLCEVTPFDPDGSPRGAAFETLSEVFRARSGERMTINPRLIEMLTMLSLAFDGRPIGLVSGFREAGRRTRQSSYHVQGMAADIAIRGVRVHALRNAAVRLGAGGVGVYPTFVHVDVRTDRPYQWVGGSRHAWRHWRARRRWPDGAQASPAL